MPICPYFLSTPGIWNLGNQKNGLYALPASSIGGALLRLGNGGKQQEALPVRVYTVVQYTHKIIGRTKVFAVDQGGDYRHDTVPTTHSTSVITKDFRIKGRNGKRSRNGVAATPNHPRYR
jgi:hypothetical protein